MPFMHDGKLLLIKQDKRILALLMRDNRLLSVKVYQEENASLLGNIYIGKISSIAPSINAAFVDIAPNMPCFLPLCDAKVPHFINPKKDHELRLGDELLVQVVRDAVKTKQPVLTTKISIAGNYLAATDDSEILGLSSKLSQAKRKEILQALTEEGCIDEEHRCLNHVGMVVRTNAGSLNTFESLISEWQRLSDELKQLLTTAPHKSCFSCLKKSRLPFLTDLKNYYTDDFEEIITDCEDIYRELRKYNEDRFFCGLPGYQTRLYTDEYSLAKLYQVQSHLDAALSSRVWLKSGAYLIIEPTEALTVIDVNSGKYEKDKSSDETFLAINIEAAKEIALQLRLRNISGIIIVDFISMTSEEMQEKLLVELRKFIKADSVKTNVIDITPLGLVEITRKRVSRPLSEELYAKEKE